MTLTPEQLDALERGLAGVTPGPWLVGNMQPQTYGPAWVSSTTVEHLADCGKSVGVDERGNAWLRIDHSVNDANAAHIARCDPATIAELIRGYRVGIAAEHASAIAAEANAFARTQWPNRQTLIDQMAAKGPLGDEIGDITVGKRKEANND